MIVIDGPAELGGGADQVQGAKNSTLPLLAATVHAEDRPYYITVPSSQTWNTAVRILEHLGSRCHWEERQPGG